MESPLTPGMSTMLDFSDETFEYPALEYGTTPGAKDIYGGYTFSQKDWDAGNKFLNGFDSPAPSANKDGGVADPVATAQTPALTTGPSAATNSSSSTSQASPTVAPDYFSRPRQPNSDGNSPHFVTAKPVESNNYSEFRKAINNRFNRARAGLPVPASDNFNNDRNQQQPTNDTFMDFPFTEFEAQQQAGQFGPSDLDAGLELREPAPGTAFEHQHHSRQESSHYPELDPDLPGAEGPGSAKAQSAFNPPPGPIVSEDVQPPPIKRRRRRKAPPSAEVKAQKHKAFLERNREAASKCRTKKKTQIQQLEEDERDGRAVNQLLKDEFRDVLGEVLLLREKVKLQDLACGGKCGGSCGAVAEGDNAATGDATISMEGVERDGDVERGCHRDEGNSNFVDAKISSAQASAAEWDSASDDEGEDEESDDDENQGQDQGLKETKRAKEPPN